MRVLLIEDDPDVLETIRSVFNNFFDTVKLECISHGDDFRRGHWKAHEWNLVILDLMIPGMTGFEICEYLRSFTKTKTVPILALTGYDTLQNEAKIKMAGATAYIAKPFEIGKLVEEVRSLLNNQ